jgi:DeoR/GlpR family transcriptional regulator of sugar metabolism
MLAHQRHRQIIQSLSASGAARTTELAAKLEVTEETIRRDFEKLEADGELVRIHGGAVSLDLSTQDLSLRERVAHNAEGKARIARAALSHIKEGLTVFFDASTTVLQLAALLPEAPLTVVTNALQTAITLAGKPNITVFVLGGKLGASSLSCTGWAAAEGLEHHRIDAAFISCKGLESSLGLSDAAEEHARIKKDVVARSSQVFLLADHTKAGVASSFFFAKNSEVDLWICDAEPRVDVLEAVTSQGMRLEVAK